jgi:hypothetical protein
MAAESLQVTGESACRFAAGNSRNSQGCSEANVQFMTVMATKMPYIGRG